MRHAKIVAFVVALSLVGMAYGKPGKDGARGGKAAAARPSVGEVVKIDDTATFKSLTYKSAGGGRKNLAAQETTVTIAETTSILVNGVAGKLTDLKVGDKVQVTSTNGVATKIQTPAPGGAGKAGGKAAKGAGKAPKVGKRNK